MNFEWNEALEILERTPQTLEFFLSGLSEGWLQCNEGEGTWSPSEVIGHLSEAERSNWLPRLKSMLHDGEPQPFPAFDRFAHLNDPPERSVADKLQEFKTLRAQNIQRLKELVNPAQDLEWTGLHPEFGVVQVHQLLATWVVHDFTHMAQIVRVMAERYRADVGPWFAYLGVLKWRG